MAIGVDLVGAALLGAVGTSRPAAENNQATFRPATGAQTGARAPSGTDGGQPPNGADGAPALGIDVQGNPVRMQGTGQNAKGRFDRFECQTCQNRTYQDGSNDPGVSFKSPTKISAAQAATAVMGHEMEHVSRNRSKAESEGREVVSQSVTLQTGICPECGKSYVAGGVTRTVTAAKQKNPYDVGKADSGENGRTLSGVA